MASQSSGAHRSTILGVIWKRSGTLISSSPASMSSAARRPGMLSGGVEPRTSLSLTTQPALFAVLKSSWQATSMDSAGARSFGRFANGCSMRSSSPRASLSRWRLHLQPLVSSRSPAAALSRTSTTLSPGIALSGTASTTFSPLPAGTASCVTPGVAPGGTRKLTLSVSPSSVCWASILAPMPVGLGLTTVQDHSPSCISVRMSLSPGLASAGTSTRSSPPAGQLTASFVVPGTTPPGT
mmetsp:Transcript_102622/g.221492  ORF Transcript_102622/g.221492 Transcript_102622/m.221492 type:complete len:239 (+) Transcript_102622:1235-1951(+)